MEFLTLKLLNMANCPSACGPIDLISNPTADCQTAQRYTNPDRLFFFGCDVDLPDPITNIGMKNLVDSGLVVFTSPLANINFGEPTIEEIQISDCNPNLKIITGRQLTAEDRIKISLDDGSPALTAAYKDYEFWQDKQNQQFSLRAGISYCNGDAKIAKDQDGNYLTLSVLVYLNYQRPSQSGGRFVEFKNITIDFNGDPLALTNVPEWNWITAGITL